MRTAIVSDLHLGSVSGEDVARDQGIRQVMLEEIGGADRVVLLGDVVELREQPLGDALAATRLFFEELGEAVAGGEIVLVPGNHDHRFAEPLLDELSISGGSGFGLEQRFGPAPGPSALVDRWLGGERLSLAYPGLWLRDDVYATHGHYVDCHLSLPRAECVAAAASMRSHPLPPRATPGDYERVLRPIYGLAYGRAQSRTVARLASAFDRPSETAWTLASGNAKDAGFRRRVAGRALRAAVPPTIWALNRLLHADFDSDLSGEAILRGGLAATVEMTTRLGIDAAHLITGHTHRGGPAEGEGDWPLPGGGRLHNTGSWVFATAFHHPGKPPSPYWPGTVTWVEDDSAPRRVQLLSGYSHEKMAAAVSLSRSAATPQ
jgi:Calcineurin-like phosphoesterase